VKTSNINESIELIPPDELQDLSSAAIKTFDPHNLLVKREILQKKRKEKRDEQNQKF